MVIQRLEVESHKQQTEIQAQVCIVQSHVDDDQSNKPRFYFILLFFIVFYAYV